MKPTLIDSNAEMPTRRKPIVVTIMHRERLSERAPRTGDAIVRTLQELNCKKLAEMSSSFLEDRKSNKIADVAFDANTDAGNNLGLIFGDTF
jgi:hypothetical protein